MPCYLSIHISFICLSFHNFLFYLFICWWWKCRPSIPIIHVWVFVAFVPWFGNEQNTHDGRQWHLLTLCLGNFASRLFRLSVSELGAVLGYPSVGSSSGTVLIHLSTWCLKESVVTPGNSRIAFGTALKRRAPYFVKMLLVTVFILWVVASVLLM